jgi:hypothetical protein
VNVYLVRRGDDGPQFLKLFARRYFFNAPRGALSSKPVAGHPVLLTAAACAEGCLIERDGITEVKRHGEPVVVGEKRYVVYASPHDTWDEPTLSEGAVPENLDEAVHVFLILPHASAWWLDEFSRVTGFEQMRDGKVPRVRSLLARVVERGVEITFDVEVWSLFDKRWLDDRERASFTRVAGRSAIAQAVVDARAWAAA